MDVLIVVDLPYDNVVPYSIWVLDASLVFQDMVAEEAVIPELLMALITGGVVSDATSAVKMETPETARFPAASRDFTR